MKIVAKMQEQQASIQEVKVLMAKMEHRARQGEGLEVLNKYLDIHLNIMETSTTEQLMHNVITLGKS